MTAEQKKCKGCGEVKPLDDFYPAKGNRDGRNGRCKACAKIQSDEWRKANPERVQAYRKRYRETHAEEERVRSTRWAREHAENRRPANKKYRERHPEKVAEIKRRYYERYPEKLKAQRIIGVAVAEGRIDKPLVCEECGFEAKEPREIHGHHEDYSKPYEVEWICAPCHRARHKPVRTASLLKQTDQSSEGESG